MASICQDVLDKLPKDKKIKDPLMSANHVLTRSSVLTLIGRVREVLHIAVPESFEKELKPFLDKRHKIIHRSKFYETVVADNSIRLQAHPFPEVSHEESTMALTIVTEIADFVLTGVANSYFSSDLGDLRPLTPPVAELHRSMRLQFQEDRARGPVIVEIANPNWNVFVRENWVFVADENISVTISPSGIDRFPMSVFCPHHTVHGEKTYITIDTGEKEEAGFMDPTFLTRLLAGKSLLVEYQSYSSDVPLYTRLSLEGFAEKWAEAQAVE